jgi:hypothetical protein
MALPWGERSVHNGGMIDGSARVRTDGQSVEAQVAARIAAGMIHVSCAVASGAPKPTATPAARGVGFVELPDRRTAQGAMAGLTAPQGPVAP